MFSSISILLFTSFALASHHNFRHHFGLPHPALWNRTCNDEHLLTTFGHPVCPKPDDGPTKPVVETAHSTPASHWTEEPVCIKTSDEADVFCVYTSATFANNRGISIFTTPAVADYLLQLPAFSKPGVLDGFNVEVNPPFNVQPLPGRGMGVIMNRTIHRGDSLFSYSPVLIIHRKVFEVFYDNDLFPFQKTAVKRLPAHVRDSFLALHGHFGGDKVNDIIHTNSFQVNLGLADESHNIVVPETSRMNHDCRPNAHYYFDINTLTHHTHAIRTIQAGEELSISYTDPTVSRAKRQKAIKQSWGFECSCSLCTQRDIFIRESDKRLELIDDLETHLDDWSDESLATPEMGETLISLYEQERLHSLIAMGYTYTALAYNAVGKAHPAIKYASLALEHHLLNSGPDFADVPAVRGMMEDPESHWSWRLRVGK